MDVPQNLPCKLASAIIANCLGFAGCSQLPSAVDPPDIDAEDVAAAVLSQYDSNSDGTIDSIEVESAPSLLAVPRIDANGDGKIDETEVKQFVTQEWIEKELGVIRVRCFVTMDGRPLDGATVTLEPEAFMQDAVKPAAGVSSGGNVAIDLSDEDRPHPNAHGAQNGLYLVRISKVVDGNETIPAKYNTQTTLGCEVAARAAYMPGPISFEMRSR